MSNVELKPCHVCGATRGLYVLEDYKDFDWYVFCDNCKTSVYNENAETKEQAIEIWNTRYEKTCQYINIDGTLYESECGLREYYVDVSLPKYCSNCGAKIVQ